MKSRKLLNIIISGTLLLSLAGCQGAKTENTEGKNKVVKVGVVGENTDQWEPVIKNLQEEGITLELVTFSDYSQPNQALADKEIDLNSFQHYAYLNQDIKDRNLDLSVIGETIIAPLGVYSNKIKSLDELKDGDSIAIPSDATNGGRALKVLESAGVIKVNEAAGYTPTLSDITQNPKNIKFVEVEAAQTPRLLADVAAALINGGHAVDAGFNPKNDSIYLEQVKEGTDNPYINIIVSRTEDKDNELYKKVVDAYRSEDVAKVIEEVYKGAYIPTWK
ncbi:MetQ/NlpA family ABC transporter substrate-binding protein [Clostridium sp. C8]|jgi:D-methionine transport system substrate-binding protein|uniref:MetQ/NlpA family ABC transporter substrate-binding protein n=1 Tax=Clostridium sp. C8 TaxID=1667357 RepID=UPI00062E5F1A|nr:MetQ/NlpA family ABC transporter substrate-binding protein [Clostridium sp. C8]KLE15529.1 metal ABC transporter substrate-binding protein [Clostridium sp. C8]